MFSCVLKAYNLIAVELQRHAVKSLVGQNLRIRRCQQPASSFGNLVNGSPHRESIKQTLKKLFAIAFGLWLCKAAAVPKKKKKKKKEKPYIINDKPEKWESTLDLRLDITTCRSFTFLLLFLSRPSVRVYIYSINTKIKHKYTVFLVCFYLTLT